MIQATAQTPQATRNEEVDNRPRFGIGHLAFAASDVGALSKFYTSIGMRLVVGMDRFAILELRGGTHLIVQADGKAGGASLDLIVDDIDETRAVLRSAGAEVGDITRGNPHDRFVAIDPEGNTLVVNSNHAIGPV